MPRNRNSSDTPEKKSAPVERRPGERICPQCGAGFVCGTEAGEARCWCAEFPPVAIDPALPGCLCPDCLNKRLKQSAPRQANL